ncbi:YD repeat-containing protein [Streptomyces venezuelae]|nr:YD repeat-containing protein [Streptomyces venezuelae]CUM44032.1 hypothetical protein BN2537_17029 [Streptomyces venezuelae]
MPDSTAETTGTSYATTRTEGTWYHHVRGIDGSGTGGATSHYCFTVDTSAPGAPAVTTVSYPSEAWAGGAQVTGTPHASRLTAPTPGADVQGRWRHRADRHQHRRSRGAADHPGDGRQPPAHGHRHRPS